MSFFIYTPPPFTSYKLSTSSRDSTLSACVCVCLSVYLPTSLSVYFLPFKVYLFYFYVYDCFACIGTHVWRSEEGIRSPETGVTGGCEPPCRCWEPNSGPLQEQQMLLTAKPSFQTQFCFCLFFFLQIFLLSKVLCSPGWP